MSIVRSRIQLNDTHPSTGDDLFLHGRPNDFDGPAEQQGDWTEGCIAVANAEIDEIWRAVADGTPIKIKP
jgi:murein L,D-transpeptidase YafK